MLPNLVLIPRPRSLRMVIYHALRLAWVGLLPLVILSACAGPKPAKQQAAKLVPYADEQVPPFARAPYEPFARGDVVAIAMREWRLFGQPVDDDPPGTRPPPAPEDKPERWPGFWQRVGEYWWLGVNTDSRESGWTGKHGTGGIEFPAREDGLYAWSAGFVSYVMRIAGAGPRFPYSGNHSDYIDLAKQERLNPSGAWVIQAMRPEEYAPVPGDLICVGRGRSASLRYDDLPAGKFPAHCDFVVETRVPGQISVIGGNVDDAVTMKHVPVTTDGKLATPEGVVLDTRYPWMVVLKLQVGAPVS